MAGGRTDVLRGVYDRWAEGDFRAAVDLFDPQIAFVVGPGFPDTGLYSGPEEIAGYMRHLLEPWDRLTIAAEEFIPAGDSIVVAVVQRGSGSESGAETEFRYFHVWSFRGDRVIRWENFREREDALAAIGLD